MESVIVDMHLSESNMQDFSLDWFNGISTIIDYLMPNPFYTYNQFYFKQFGLG